MRTRIPVHAVPAALVLAIALATTPGAAAGATAPPKPSHPAEAARATAQKQPRVATARNAAAPRTLEAIRIEGEIPVPQVLFITARDQRRFMDLHHRRYLLNSLEIGERAGFPSALTVVRTPASGATREMNP